MAEIKHLFLGVIALMLCNSCDKNADLSKKLPSPVYSQPPYSSLNIGDGYTINPITGDSIESLLNVNGDTLVTGVPVKIQSKVFTPSQLQKRVVTARPPKDLEISQNRHFLPDQLNVTSISTQDIQSCKVGEPYPGVSISDDQFDKICSGLSVPATLVAVPSIMPQPVPAALPNFKDVFRYNIRYLDVEQGMNSSRVNTVLEDSRGNMWFGTHGGGLTKYNGISFTFYTMDHGLNGNMVTHMIEDSQGNIWFGTWENGIGMFNGKTFFHFSTNQSLKNFRINSLLEDSNRNIWIATNGGGVSMFDGNNFTCYTTNEGLSSNNITSILEDEKGLLWFGSNEGGVISFNGEYFTHYTVNEDFSSNKVMLEDSQGNLWIGTGNNGLCKFDGERIVHYTSREGLSDDDLVSLIEDQSGNIWIGTAIGGLNLFDGKSFLQITDNAGLSDNTITSIYEDQLGYLWIGTQDGGVNIFDPTSFAHFTELEELIGSNVRSIREDDQDNYWFTTWGGGVICYDGNQLRQYTADHGLMSNTIWDMVIDKHGNQWYGGDGICMFDGYRFTHMAPGHGILSIIEDRNGNLWFGTMGTGVLKYDGENMVQYSPTEGFTNDPIWSMTEDQQGNLWFATWGGGVAKYDGEYFTFFTEKEGLIHNDVWSVLEDKRGNLWCGTYGEGVSIFNGKGFTHISTEQGLSNNIVNSIIEDNGGNIWLGTENGLTQIIINQEIPMVSESPRYLSQKRYEILSYGRNDGLKATDFNVHSNYLDRKNRIWWGTGKSLVMLDMNDFEVDKKRPMVFLDRIDIAGNFIDYVNLNDSLKRTITFDQVEPFTNHPKDLEIPFKSNHLTFHFTANNCAAPHNTRYSYKLADVSSNWSQLTVESKAEYLNIPYGQHTFMISAMGSSGTWCEPTGYTFRVLPPWWHTWWARAGYLLVAVALTTGIVRWRTANIKQRQKELEQMVQERTAEVVAQQKRSDELLLNILPANVAEELKNTGQIQPVHFEEVSILFADFKEFTNIVASIPSKKLIHELNDIFQNFDDIMEQRGLEKIQTVGDAYVAACGLPKEDPEHALKCAEAARDIIEYLSKRNEVNSIKWKVRIGIHSGPITAGVVGKKKFTYDVFGDTVNIAARIQSASSEGRINVSAYTHDLIKERFPCEYRGKIQAKGKGDLDMYFVVDNNKP